MRKKCIVPIATAIVFVLSTTVPAFGDANANSIQVGSGVSSPSKQQSTTAKINQDKAKKIAIEILKNYFDVSIDTKKFNIQLDLGEMYIPGESEWNVNLNYGDSKSNFHGNVAVNADSGKVTRVYFNEYYNDTNLNQVLPSVTEDQAKETAEKFLKRIKPEELKQCILNDNIYPSGKYDNYQGYNFTYQRVIDGIEISGNNITVGVNGINGKIISFSFNWDDNIKTIDKQNIIDNVKAEEIFRKEGKLDLGYFLANREDYSTGKKPEVILTYAVGDFYGYTVDAKTGKMLDWTGREKSEMKKKNLSPEAKKALEAKYKPSVNLSKEIDQEEAQKIMAERVKKLFGSDYKIQYVNYEEGGMYGYQNASKIWTAQFTKGEDRSDNQGNISINALNGQILSLYKFNDYKPNEEFTPKLTWEQAYDKAIDTIAEYYPQTLKNIDTEQIFYNIPEYIYGKAVKQRYYYFGFTRKEGEINFVDNNVSVQVDAKTGEVNQINLMWNESINFPKPEVKISADKAKDIFFKTYKPKLMYSKFNKSFDYKKPQWEYKFTYGLNTSGTVYPSGINAQNGKLMDYMGREISQNGQDSFKNKIKGHAAEKELNIFYVKGIIDADKFDINGKLNMLELIKLLVKAKGYEPYMIRDTENLKFTNIKSSDEYYSYLQMAVMYGIIDNKADKLELNEMVTREKLAEILIKTLKYEKIARADDIFKLSYKDAAEIAKDKVGAVALCKGLGIIDGKTEYFKPKDEVSMVDACVMIYKTLNEINK